MKKSIKKRTKAFKNIIILFVTILIFVFFTTKVFAKDFKNTTSYTVEYNDTLWNIAKYICNNSSNKNRNIQKTVCEIKKLNNMTSSNIFEGQELLLPIY